MHEPSITVQSLLTTSKSQLQDIINTLRREEVHANAVTLLGRLEHGDFSEHSYLLLAGPFGQRSTEPWLIAFVDRSRRPETELYMLCSWEIENDVDPEASYKQLSAVFRRIRRLGLPESIHEQGKVAAGTEIAAINHTNVVFTCGAIHESTYKIIKQHRWISTAYDGKEVPYRPYIFCNDSTPAVKDLPDGLRWDKLRVQDYELVRSTSAIPRQGQTLMALISVAIFDDKTGEPAAWGFVGMEGSLSTLYVVPQHRGKGLGVTLCLRLLEKQFSRMAANERRLGHSFIALDNQASIKTAQAAGGKAALYVAYWLRIDLDKVRVCQILSANCLDESMSGLARDGKQSVKN